MPDKFFLSASGADPVGTVQGLLHGSSPTPERVLWSGRCAVAEYAFDEPASLPRWTLPEHTEVVVTENRVAYADAATQTGGELHWPWPQHLRVQPGNRNVGRSATVTQIQLVCAGPAGAFPALVFAGGDLATVADADRLANVLRQAIARFRVENTAELGLTLPQSRMLSRLVIGPEFSNYQGGEGQTVSLLGAVAVDLPRTHEPFLDEYFAPTAYSPDPYPPEAYASPDSYWATAPGPAADPYAAPSAGPFPAAAAPYAAPSAGSFPAAAADPYAGAAEPYATSSAAVPYPSVGQSHDAGVVRPELVRHDLAARAADLAARVAGLVAGGAGLGSALASYENQTTNLSAFLGPAEPYASATEYGYTDELPAGRGDSAEGVDRAEAIRRTAARFTGNSARARGSVPRRPADDDLNAPTRGHHTP